jgi:hypothetical protein
MNAREANSDTIDWTRVERTVERELLDRAKQVAQQIAERVRKVTEDTAQARSLGPDESTGLSPPVG